MNIDVREVHMIAETLRSKVEDDQHTSREVYEAVAEAAVELMRIAIEYEGELPKGVMRTLEEKL